MADVDYFDGDLLLECENCGYSVPEYMTTDDGLCQACNDTAPEEW